MVAVHPITNQFKEKHAYHAIVEEDEVFTKKNYKRRPSSASLFKKISERLRIAKNNVRDVLQDCYNKEVTMMITE